MNINDDLKEEIEPILIEIMMDVLSSDERSSFVRVTELGKEIHVKVGLDMNVAKRASGTILREEDLAERWTRHKSPVYEINEDAVKERAEEI